MWVVVEEGVEWEKKRKSRNMHHCQANLHHHFHRRTVLLKKCMQLQGFNIFFSHAFIYYHIKSSFISIWKIDLDVWFENSFNWSLTLLIDILFFYFWIMIFELWFLNYEIWILYFEFRLLNCVKTGITLLYNTEGEATNLAQSVILIHPSGDL